ncbi:short-chain fatty acid transporter [Paeniglutamicibacter sulfureus]|uniref:Short-chain fatty acids transporter n=1 Tax=Paeniglutamicibacter sulfureus TaxID=43666 RepID=A0ABU2BN41_9MICC|nr:TIGR00366 family protein [Paeniglutamicibacter sulfureus]MDR7359666.1 short-chain fatty acids transporter [Paeniglutamicibacter sulfureus]
MSKTAAPQGGTAISRAMRPVNNLVERFIPSALVFAIALTFIVALLAVVVTRSSPLLIVQSWGDGLAGLLAFITQMALVLMLGFILANTRPVRRLLRFLGRVPQTALAGYVFVFLVAAVASLITWGLGLVVGGLLAREVAAQGRERGIAFHFPMLVASGFAGFVVWHMGYSGSGPLTAATPDSFIAKQLGGPLSISETTFSSWNMIAAVAAIVMVALSLYLVAPRGNDKIVELVQDAREELVAVDDEVTTPADRLDASRLPTLLLGAMLLAYLVIHFSTGGTLTLDIVNWSFLALILLLVRSPFELMALTKHAASNVGEILLQFPLYAGILGIMTGTGLIQVLSDVFVSISTPQTFGVLAFLSAGLVNFFVPSGGGQFAVQAPIMLTAAAELGVDPSIPIMAVAYGDQWTNMIQPFWALPLLAIAGLKMRDILGYTTIVLVASGIVFAATLLIVSF